MFSWHKYLIVNLVLSHLGFWSGNLFLIAPFPDLCLLVSFLYCIKYKDICTRGGGVSKSLRKSAAKFVIVIEILRCLYYIIYICTKMKSDER